MTTPLLEGGHCRDCACDLDAAVVIPVYNAMPLLRDQLEALARQDTPVAWELVLADNGSTESICPTVEEFASRFHRVTVVDASTVRGPAHARNAGARAARGRVLLFCDADDVADRFWVHAMHRASRVGVILGGRMDYSALNELATGRWRQHLQSTELPTFYGHPYAMSSNMAVCRSDFERLGGFDESFPEAAGEDVDLPVRAARVGITCLFVEDAVIAYRLRSDRAGNMAQARAYARGALTLFKKHAGTLTSPTFLDSLTELLAIGADDIRGKVGRSGSEAHRWTLRYQLTQSRGLMMRPAFWRPVRAYPSALTKFHGLPRRLAARSVRRAHARLGGERSAEAANVWEIASRMQGLLTQEERHLLGLGLLSTADVTLQVVRPRRVMHVNPAMDPIVASVLKDGTYSEDEIDRVHRHIHDGRSSRSWIVNVGANVGTTAIALAERGWHVLAIEPVPRAAQLLRQNVRANHCEATVRVVECAVTAERTLVEMVAGDNLSTSEVRNGHSIEELATPGDTRATAITVEGRTLIDILADADVSHTDMALVWSDTEGFEGAVIAGGRGLWRAGVPLWVEIRPSALLDHGSITDFCALVADNFDYFQTLEDLSAGATRPTSRLRDFIDELGFDRWSFTNVLMTTV